MSDRPTPETNSIILNAQAADHPPTRLAATLTVKCEKLERESDEAQEELEEYRSIAENIGAVKARTPETDDFELNLGDYSHPWKAIDLARKLERERDDAREALAKILKNE